MARFRSLVRRSPFLTRSLMFPYRLHFALGYCRQPASALIAWLFNSRETENFTYDLTPMNKRYLVALLEIVTRRPYEELWSYLLELDRDEELREHVFAITRGHKGAANVDTEARWGRRLGWYVLARAMRPKVIVETGVDKGLGSCVLTSALIRNARNGAPGRYFGTDINPKAGFLLTGKYREFGQVLYGDSIETLKRLDCSIDLFINDSDHSADYEAREYETISGKLSTDALVLGDNAHVTDKLLDFARQSGRQYAFFQERPDRHWYPGAGIGVAFRTAAVSGRM